MNDILKKIILLTYITAFCCLITPTVTNIQAAEELKLAYQYGEAVENITLQEGEKEDLRFLNAPSDWASLHPTWFSSNPDVVSVNSSGVISANKSGTAIVLLRLDNGMIGYVTVCVTEIEKEEAFLEVAEEINVSNNNIKEITTKKEEEVTDFAKEEKLLPQILLKNQEQIHIKSNAAFTDGSLVNNMIDVALYAFSYATSDGNIVKPTLEDDLYGITEITNVTYRTIKSRKTVIIDDVYFKVFLDANQDGIVSKTEKTTDAIGYYIIKVNVDRTLTIEDWSIVQ